MNALIVVDVQNDFCPGGNLAVPRGDEVIHVINSIRDDFDLVVFTQDWHPKGHKSFASAHEDRKPGEVIPWNGLAQIHWPDHCIQNSPGAAFHPGLDIRPGDPVFQKGTDPNLDSYSAFYDNGHRKSTGLTTFLRERDALTLTLVGLATDYCVKFSALDAIADGFKVSVFTPACRGVDLQAGDSARALEEIREREGQIIELAPLDLLQKFKYSQDHETKNSI